MVGKIKKLRFRIGNRTFEIPEEVIEEMRRKMRELFGPNPPCEICGKESTICISPRPMQPETWIEDLARQIEFGERFPLGAFFCDGHSDEEISEWFRKRGVRLNLRRYRG